MISALIYALIIMAILGVVVQLVIQFIPALPGRIVWAIFTIICLLILLQALFGGGFGSFGRL